MFPDLLSSMYSYTGSWEDYMDESDGAAFVGLLEEDDSITYIRVSRGGDIRSYGMHLKEAYETFLAVKAFIQSEEPLRCADLKHWINNALTSGIKCIYLFAKGGWSVYDSKEKKFHRFGEDSEVGSGEESESVDKSALKEAISKIKNLQDILKDTGFDFEY